MSNLKKVSLQQYNIAGKDLDAFLGPLEAMVMETVWSSQKKPITVREVYETLKKNKKIAYTTVMTIMDRLHQKRLLDRKGQKSGGRLYYVYWPAIEKQNFQKSAIREVLSSLVSNFGGAVTACLVEERCLSKEDLELLREQLNKAEDNK